MVHTSRGVSQCSRLTNFMRHIKILPVRSSLNVIRFIALSAHRHTTLGRERNGKRNQEFRNAMN